MNKKNDDATQDATLHISHVVQHPATTQSDTSPTVPLTKNSADSKNQQLLQSKFITHNPKAGLNPLVDAAAYLFSIVGKLKQLKSYRNLTKLHQELIAEINNFQEAVKAQGYTPEYSLVSRYALCATLDDIIINTPWGGQGQWDAHSMLTVFNQETAQQERFFLILERIIKDPALYIDLMEFMYICLSLGYKGSYSSTDFSNHQLEKITHALYKRIRAFHGNFHKNLSPVTARTTPATAHKKARPRYGWLVISAVGSLLLIFIGLRFTLDSIANNAYQELMHIGKSILYEPHES